MKIIIIDENYPGIKQVDYWYELENPISFPTAHIIITVPLRCKSIFGGYIEAHRWVEASDFINAVKSIHANESIHVDTYLKAGKNLKVHWWVRAEYDIRVGGYIKADEWIETGERLEAGKAIISGRYIEAGSYIIAGKEIRSREYIITKKFIQTNTYIYAGDTIKVEGSIKANKGVSVFGRRTTKYCRLFIDGYQVIISSTHLKIGCWLYNINKWKDFSNKSIANRSGELLEWWKKQKDFILSVAETLPEINFSVSK